MDNDDAGQKANQKLGTMLAEIPGISAVRYANCPADTKEKDLDDLVRAGKSDLLTEIINGAVYGRIEQANTSPENDGTEKGELNNAGKEIGRAL